MHKCPKCGTEFEGKFCPECGEKFAEEKTCPKCGATLSGSAKFCNECDDSFYKKSAPVAATDGKIAAAKPTKAETWMKKHKAWVAVISSVLIVAIIVAIAVPIGLANRHNGVYYVYNGETEEYDMTRYYELKGDTWKDQNERKGKISFDGENVTITYDPSNGMDKTGSSVTTKEGTIVGDVLKVGGTVYAKEGHEHRFGDWEVEKNSTCVEVGTKKRVCICGKTEWRETALAEHTLENVTVEATCTDAGWAGTRCKVCGKENGSYREDALHIKYTLSDDRKSYCVSSLSSECQHDTIVIPQTYKGLTVTSIGSNAFDGCEGLKSIVISDSVTSIGGSAFDGTAYYHDETKWDESGVLYIGNHLIEAKTTISGTYVIREGTKTIANNAFYNCSGLTSIEIPDSVTSIGSYAFSGCSGLKSVTIPDGVTEIGEYAFSGCSGLTSVTFGSGVTSIGGDAFYNCSGLTGVNITDLAAWCKIDFGSSRANPLDYAHHLYLDDVEVKDLTIPSEIKWIKDYAFIDCNGLTSITIPNSVTTIGGDAFSGCSGLKSVTIPDSVTSIGGSAFSGCSGLERITVDTNNPNYSSQDGILYNKEKTEFVCVPDAIKGAVTIPDGVTEIGDYAFSGCSGLTSITIPNSVTTIGGDAFSGCSGLKSVTIPDSVTSIGSSAFEDCSSLTSITIPDSVTSIGSDAFRNCSGLESVTIGNGVTEIESSAFSGCSRLKSVTIPDSVTTIGWDAFYNCSGLTGVNITDLAAWCKIDFARWSSNPLVYAHHLYLDNAEVKDLTIPAEVSEIKSYAFYNCSGLTSITIPDSVTSIGSYAFRNCSGLESVTIGNGVTEIGDYAFSDCSGLTSIKIPDGVTEIGDYAFSDCSGLTSVTIPDSVTEIGGYAFSGCSGLTSITIPDSVTSTGRYAFSGCSGLTSIYIPDSVTTIGVGAFSNCSRLNDIQFKGTVAEWQAIEKGRDWNNRIGNYTVTCTDGTVKKDGTVTYFGE